jgi:hypothetical protein
MLPTANPIAPTTCELTLFLNGVLEGGSAAVSAGPLRCDEAQALAALKEIDSRARAELGIEAPGFSEVAALWGARLTYHLAQFTVCRDIGQEQIEAVCKMPCPVAASAETVWSVDLTLRHLPKLYRLARHLSGGDPLVNEMQRIAAEWPLSSVGIPVENPDARLIMEHPALARIYADRIFAEGDLSRLGDLRVDELLRRDLGMHRELAPALASKLFAVTNEGN